MNRPNTVDEKALQETLHIFAEEAGGGGGIFRAC